jgi:hypothetical protein
MNNSKPTPTLITYAVNEALLVLLCIEHSQTGTLMIQLLFVALALQIRRFVLAAMFLLIEHNHLVLTALH